MKPTICDDELTALALGAECSRDLLEKGICRTFAHAGKTWTTIGGWWKPSQPDRLGGHCWEVVPAEQYPGEVIPWREELPAGVLSRPGGLLLEGQDGRQVVVTSNRLEVMTAACRDPVPAAVDQNAVGRIQPEASPPPPRPEPIAAVKPNSKGQLSLFD